MDMWLVLVRKPKVDTGPSCRLGSVVDSFKPRAPAPNHICPAVHRTQTSKVKAVGSMTSDPYRVPSLVVCVLSPDVNGSAFCCDSETAFEPSRKLSPPNDTDADCDPIV